MRLKLKYESENLDRRLHYIDQSDRRPVF